MTKAQLQKRLDALASEINAIAGELTKQYGEGANLYFEAGGTIYALTPERRAPFNRDATPNERQARVIASSSEYCNFDCGAW
jgi:hypothetical protein